MPRKNKDDFEQSGLFKIKMDINIEVSEEDMLRDLAKRTEGKMIKPKPNKFSEN